jgi:hypothetical protein
MVKTTTLKEESPIPAAKKIERVNKKEFGPSEFTIQSILNYSKALQVIKLSGAATAFGVMN